MSRFPETILSLALTVALLTPAGAQTPAPAEAPAAGTVPADAQPPEAATPGASAGSDGAAQHEAAVADPATPGAAEGEGSAMSEKPAAAADASGAPEDPAGAGAAATAWPGAGKTMKLGRAALPEEIAAWDKDVRPDGLGLPPGSADVATGEELFSEHCASCHGDFAEGVDNWPKLAGGMNTLDHEDPLKTVGSYWPYLSTAWDYVHRSMPFGAAQTLDVDQTYAVVAYILYSNDLVDEDFVLDQDSFRTVQMPNADGFIVDDRETAELPQFTVQPCMENCKETVEITRHATNLDVTPGDPDDGADSEGAPALD